MPLSIRTLNRIYNRLEKKLDRLGQDRERGTHSIAKGKFSENNIWWRQAMFVPQIFVIIYDKVANLEKKLKIKLNKKGLIKKSLLSF